MRSDARVSMSRVAARATWASPAVSSSFLSGHMTSGRASFLASEGQHRNTFAGLHVGSTSVKSCRPVSVPRGSREPPFGSDTAAPSRAVPGRSIDRNHIAPQRAFLSSLPNYRSSVTLTATRLDQLLEAEITMFSLRKARNLKLESMFGTTTDADAVAELLHEELPVRFAHRIKMLEELPGWRTNTPIDFIRQQYITSFKLLRMANPSRVQDFRDALLSIKKRHQHTTLLVDGFREMAASRELNEQQSNEWLDKFFRLRIATNMLTSHYLHIFRAEVGSRPEFMGDQNPYQSRINPLCQPVPIARHAGSVVKRMCTLLYGSTPDVEITDAGAQPLPFVPRYLFYIISEILKNSVNATVVRSKNGAAMTPVRVLISGDGKVVSVRISDQGGGIPLDRLDHVWSYLYSTSDRVGMRTTTTRPGVDAPTDVRMLPSVDTPTSARRLSRLEDVNSLEDPENPEQMRSPLGGLGCGLPLSRLYARYLGGRLELQTMPGYGTDVFIYLRHLGEENH